MNKFIKKAKQYIDLWLEINPNQWEYNGAEEFGEFSSLADIVQRLDHENPNVRIHAARMLKYLKGPRNLIGIVVSALTRYSYDTEMNRVSSEFQCEDEPIYVCDEVKETIKTLQDRICNEKNR